MIQLSYDMALNVGQGVSLNTFMALC